MPPPWRSRETAARCWRASCAPARARAAPFWQRTPTPSGSNGRFPAGPRRPVRGCTANSSGAVNSRSSSAPKRARRTRCQWSSSEAFRAMVRAMPARQLWVFLTDADLRELIERIGAREPGLAVSQGRYLRGDPQALLRDPISLERRESLPGERRIYLLHRKHAPAGELEPSRVYAHVTFWRAADKARKRPMFSIWASQTMKWLAAQLPPTSAKMIRIGPDALAQARGGRLRLTYLYRAIAP